MKEISIDIERRTEKRQHESFLVRYSGSTDPKNETTTFVKFAATFNVSESGLCFRSPMPFEKTHRLTFLCDELWEGEREGVVRWCNILHPGIYKIGVALL